MFKTVKSKFIFTSLVFVILGVGGPATFLILQFRNNFEERSKMMLETSLDVIDSCIDHSMLYSNKNIQEIIESHINDNIRDIRIINADGIITYATTKSEIGTDIKLVSTHQTIDLNKKNIILQKDEEFYSATVPINNKQECQTCHKNKAVIGYLDMDFNLTEAETYFYTGVQHTLFLSLTLIIFLISGLDFIFNRFINKPLHDVMRALSEVEKGNLAVRQPIKHDDEFDSLNMHFNTMVTQLEKSLREIDQFHFKQLQRADKLVTLGELAAEMAHEINNPTGVIMTRADFLKLESEENRDLKKYNDDIKVIISQADKIAQITKTVLKYSKKRQQDYQVMDLSVNVENSLKLFTPSLVKRNILVKSSLIDENKKGPFIMGDSQQIEQVITNILNNSIDAVDSDGKIEINIKCTDTGTVELTIEDNGPGIDPDTKEHIFLPFFTTKIDKDGTGLGLYIVKNICQHHDAVITCDSAVNKGTKFTIIFNQVNNS